MKGLLIKDIKLLGTQKTFFISICIFSLIMIIGNFDPSFIVGYLTFIFSLFVISTISYDDYNNGFSFLFTLPVTRETYVRSKFLLSLLLGLTSCIFAIILSAGAVYITTQTLVTLDWVLSQSIACLVIFTLLSIMIPMQLKFGSEKSRIVMLVFYGGIFGIGAFITVMMGPENAQALLKSILSTVSSMNQFIAIGSVLVVLLGILLSSYLISVKVMKNKQF
jgi:ABC-2 type transport system permease protein